MVHDSVDVGSRWPRSSESLILDVPSVLMPHSRNMAINPEHPRMAEVLIEIVTAVPFGNRLSP